MGARELHESLVVIDGHCDTAIPAAGFDFKSEPVAPLDLCVRNETGHVDFPRLREGGVTAQFFALFTDTAFLPEAREHTLRLLAAMESAIDRSGGRARLATKAADVVAAKRDGTLAAFLAIEGGEAIGESLDDLRSFYDRGVRLMTLTWNRVNAIGRGAEHPGPDGLTRFGLEVVSEMERLGMIVDASHLSDRALDDLLAVASRPVVASHSNSRAVCDHRRNLTDAQAERIAATGGLVGVTFAGVFVDSEPARVSVSRVLDHVDRLVAAVGPGHVGLGTDFDGFSAPYGLVMPDCSRLADITAGLLGRGYSDEDAARIMGGNWLRVIEAVAG
ncbi:MAG: dipeptidase [Spirochaetes bacterium]|nr:dipeptidase [Spirochaetota bacterium]MBU1081162.1 dipeptidase [Spirochaetota bacterium]